MKLEKEIVLVTGATAGFGLSIARACLGAGARVIGLGRRSERLSELVHEFGQDNFHALVCDIRESDDVMEKINALPERFSPVSVLVNNAGLAVGHKLAQDSSFDGWKCMVETNVTGLLAATHAILPGMVARNHGYVINIGSVAGSYSYPKSNVYGGTKAFINHFSRNLKSDLLGTKVRVTCIEPGYAKTEFAKVRLGNEYVDEMYMGMDPIRPEDIADIVLFCLSVPARININTLEVMSTSQAWSPLASFHGFGEGIEE